MALIANVAICYNSSLHDLCHMTDNRVAPFFFYLSGLNVSDIRTYFISSKAVHATPTGDEAP
jgi:hypothetical protein